MPTDYKARLDKWTSDRKWNKWSEFNGPTHAVDDLLVIARELFAERGKLADFVDSVRGMILECSPDPPFDPLERLWKIYRQTFELAGEPIRGSRHEMEIEVLGSSRHYLRAAIRSYLKSGDRETLVATMNTDDMVMGGTTPFCRETAERSRSKLLTQIKEQEAEIKCLGADIDGVRDFLNNVPHDPWIGFPIPLKGNE